MSKARKIENIVNSDDYDKAVIYCRVSSDRQKNEGHGLDSQEHRCRELARTKGYEVVEVFKDSYSGAGDFMQRPAMAELLAYVDRNAHNQYVVIFDDMSRFARDVQVHFRLRQAFDTRKIKIECPNFNFEDTPEGQLVETMMAAQHEYHRKNNRRQVVQKQKARLESGYWPFGPKRGYRMVKQSEGGKLAVPVEPDASLIREAVEGYANGTFSSKTDACSFLVESGFWKNQKPERYISKFTDMIDSPFLAGYIEYPQWGVSLRKGKHEGIVSLDVLNDAKRKSGNEHLGKEPRKDKSNDFPLRGLIKCAGCNNHLTAYWSTGRSGKKYGFYECKNKDCPLEEKTLRKEDVEEQYSDFLREIAVRDCVIEMLEHVFEEVWASEVSSMKEGEAKRQQKEEKLQEKIDQLTDMVINAADETLKRTYEKQLQKVVEELEELRAKTFDEASLDVPYRTALNKSTGLLKSPYKIWDSVDVHEKHRLFFFLFEEKLPYSKKTGYRTDNLSCAIRVFEEFLVENSQDVEMAGVEPASELGCDCESTVHSIFFGLK